MNNILRRTIAAIDSILNFSVVVFLVSLLMIGCYVIWDNQIVHTQGSHATWKAYKPTTIPTYTYDELREQNSDVIGWVDVYGTGIDYPVMYSKESGYYLFRDPFKNNSLIGSIYMDSSCSPDWSDFVIYLYGHHMEQNCMFGSISEFQKKDFFDSHPHGDMFYNEKHHGIKILGIIKTNAGDPRIYQIGLRRSSEISFLNTLENLSVYWRNDYNVGKDQICLMWTCADETEINRFVLVTALTDEVFEDPYEEEDGGINLGLGVDDLKGWLGFPWVAWFAALVVVVMITIYILWQVNNYKENERIERMVSNNDKFKK